MRFVFLSLLSMVTGAVPALAAQHAVVSAAVARLYEGPSARFDTLKKLPRGSKLQISNFPKQGFYKARVYDGTVGWIEASRVTVGAAIPHVPAPIPSAASTPVAASATPVPAQAPPTVELDALDSETPDSKE